MSDWTPKVSDCYLITGGQIQRLRDAATQEEAQAIVDQMRTQRYRGGKK